MVGTCLHCRHTFKKREVTRKFCSLICANNYNRNNVNIVQLPQKCQKLAEFVGIVLGDGYVSRYQVAITLNSCADAYYIPYVIDLAVELFPGASISIVNKVRENATDIRVNSVCVAKFLTEMGLVPHEKKIPAWIFKKTSYTRSCIRGLFDTEGSISFKIYKAKNKMSLYKQLNFRGVNKELMRFVRNNLVSMGMKPTRTLKASLYLSNDKQIELFKSLIGFSNPKLSIRSEIKTYAQYLNKTALQFRVS